MDALLALHHRFGPELSLERDGSGAVFSFDGQRAMLECEGDLVRATFYDRPARDVALGRSWIPRYRCSSPAYSLAEADCERLARDVSDFFGGTREPRFAFESLI